MKHHNNMSNEDGFPSHSEVRSHWQKDGVKSPILIGRSRSFGPSTSNVGIRTGEVRNLVVVDIDMKDGGMDHWMKLITKIEEPNTIKVRTGGGDFIITSHTVVQQQS